MRYTFLAKTVAVVVLIILTLTITTSIIAQRSNSKVVPGKALPVTQTQVSKGGQDAVAAKIRGADTSISSDAMTSYEIALNGRELHIKASAYIKDQRNYSYFWNLRIIKADDLSEVFSKQYIEQTFQLPPGDVMEPTFEDIIPLALPAGLYGVETSIFRVTPEYGLDGMHDPEIAKFLRSPRGMDTFSLD